VTPEELRQIGPYPVREFIAEGGMAWVFEVVDPRFNARRALKMLKPSAAGGEEFRRFESEARLLAALDHPNLVTIFDFGRDESTGCYYYTMQFIDGPPLSQRGPLPLAEAGPLFLDVLAGLAALHDAGVVHRDIKPANVLLTSDGRALLADLGIARVQEEASLTRTGMAIGTALYMSPEQARGKSVGPSGDVFSMGLSIYQVLAGQTVYDATGDVDSSSGQDVILYLGSLIHSGSELKIPFPASIPPAVRTVIRRACRFDPAQRYGDAREMHAALLGALEAKPPALWPRYAAGAALAAVLAIGAWQALRWWRNRPPAPAPAAEAVAPTPLPSPTPVPTLPATPAHPPEPQLVTRTPRESAVVLHRNEVRPFSVEVKSPTDSPLHYTWSLDGVAQPTSGASYELRAERNAQLSVQVKDDTGGSISERWEVTIEHRKPELRLLPAGAQAPLEVGERREFRIETNHPDGDPITTRFLVDGKPVAEGSSYTFHADKPGNFLLTARATDPQGAMASVDRRIEVYEKVAATATPPPPEPARTDSSAAPPAPVVARTTPPESTPNAAPHRDPREAALAALAEYKAAYESRNIDRLSRVWIMNATQRARMKDTFEAADSINVQIEQHDVVVEEDSVTINFRQELTLTGPSMTTKGAASENVATVIRRGEDQWVISSIYQRK
jgi:serine/threonine-protein kinase